MTLAPVHRGYAYQDLFTASRLVDVLVGDAFGVVVDRKLFAGDRFDDLTGVLRTPVGGPLRRREQVKWIDRAVPLELADLTTVRRRCRLDRLVAVAAADRAMANAAAGVTEYRLVMTATPPTDPRVQRLLLPADETAPAHPEWQTQRYRIDANAVWPTEQGQVPPPEWSFLRSAVAREELTRFAAEFVLELGAPVMSGDLTDPGPAEQVLLARLAEDVGAGLYPNERRHPVDVAALLVATAAAARAGLSGVDRASLLTRTGLREDFGAVARGKLVDLSREVTVQETRARLLDACAHARAARSALAIVDAPGSGKSWAVDRLCRDLEADGWLILRHYCYLAPGDPDGEARVRSAAVIGSLLGQLAEAVPVAVAGMRPRFAADIDALAAALAEAGGRTGRDVAVVVDGLDHVTRVLGAAPGRRDRAAELVEMLSLLELPDNAVLVVASQPGEHLAALRDHGVVEVGLPP